MTAHRATVKDIVDEAVGDVIDIRDQEWALRLINQAADDFEASTGIHDALESKFLPTNNLARRIHAFVGCLPQSGSSTNIARRDMLAALVLAEEACLEWEDANEDSLAWISAARAILHATNQLTAWDVMRWTAAAHRHMGRCEALATS